MGTPSDAPLGLGPTPEMEAEHARAAAAHAEWKTLSEEEKAARTAEGWEEYRRRFADGTITLPPRIT